MDSTTIGVSRFGAIASATFAGTWTYFPYFDSGITIAGGIAELFILRPTLYVFS
jgi:hypothetical protein